MKLILYPISEARCRIQVLYPEDIQCVTENDYYLFNNLNIEYKYCRDKKIVKGTSIKLVYPMDFNYGHFTHDCIQFYLYCFYKDLIRDNVKIIIDRKFPFQRELVKLFGMDKFNLLISRPSTQYIFENIIYYKNYYNLSFDVGLLDKFNVGINQRQTRQKLYITRINNPSRRLLNEQAVIDFLRKREFKIVDFDTISVSEQIKLVQESEVICLPHGSAGLNLLYKNKEEKFKVIEIFSENCLDPSVPQFLFGKNCEYSAVVGKVILGKFVRDGDFLVNLRLLEQALETNTHVFRPISNGCKNT